MGRLRGREHDSTPQSGVVAPRQLKRSLSRLYYCCCYCACCCLLLAVAAVTAVAAVAVVLEASFTHARLDDRIEEASFSSSFSFFSTKTLRQRLQAAFSAAETGATLEDAILEPVHRRVSSLSISARTVTNCSTTSGIGASRAGRPGAASTSCSTVRCWTRTSGLTSTRRSGRVPSELRHALVEEVKELRAGLLGGGLLRNVAV